MGTGGIHGCRRRSRILATSTSRNGSHAEVLSLVLDRISVDVARPILGADDEIELLVGRERRRRTRGRAGGRCAGRGREVLTATARRLVAAVHDARSRGEIVAPRFP